MDYLLMKALPSLINYTKFMRFHLIHFIKLTNVLIVIKICIHSNNCCLLKVVCTKSE